jgi:hypothetical protein
VAVPVYSCPSAFTVAIDNPRPVYQPGETLSGWYRFTADEAVELQALEVSVLWHTQGPGDEDFGIHFFERRQAQEDEALDPSAVRRFQTRLPVSPLSYRGQVVSILWCVRVRALLPGGREVVGEASFQLGAVAPT